MPDYFNSSDNKEDKRGIEVMTSIIHSEFTDLFYIGCFKGTKAIDRRTRIATKAMNCCPIGMPALDTTT